MKVFFAPIQGYTEAPYRLAHSSIVGGIEKYYSPFIRYEHSQIRRKDLRDISPASNPDNLVPQVIASSVEDFDILCRAVIQEGYREIDLNMGCPFPMQARQGKGTGLLCRPDAVSQILLHMEELQKASGVRFSVKMRLGDKDPDEFMAIMDNLNSAPLEHITIHPRIGTQQYKGELIMDRFDRFMSMCAHPVIFNGDIASVSDIAEVMDRYPSLEGIMIGRGLLRRPTLSGEASTGTAADQSTVQECILAIHDKVLAHYQDTLEGGDGQILQKIQTFWEYPAEHFDKKTIKKLTKTRSLDSYIRERENMA